MTRTARGVAVSTNTSYEPFSRQPEYLELNRCFIRSLLPYLDGLAFVVDLACGVGTLTGLLAAELERENAASASGPIGREPSRGPRVLGVDLSRESLGLARESFSAPAAPLRTLFVQGSGESLPAASSVADGVLLGNAIHLFADKQQLVQEVSRVLRRQGFFAFNTAFHAGARPEETGRFYEEWARRALGYAKQRAERRREATSVSADRRGSGPVAFSNPWLSPREYRDLVERAGFRILTLTERTVEMSRSNLEAIGSYAEYASTQLRGYPVELAVEALVTTVAPAFEAARLMTVSRVWLEVIAVKR